jgi:hypothetical protein
MSDRQLNAHSSSVRKTASQSASKNAIRHHRAKSFVTSRPAKSLRLVRTGLRWFALIAFHSGQERGTALVLAMALPRRYSGERVEWSPLHRSLENKPGRLIAPAQIKSA